MTKRSGRKRTGDRPTPNQRQFILNRDGHRCVLCGETNPNLLTMGHIIPHSLGGAANPDNLQVECKQCNNAKGDTCTREDFARGAMRGEPGPSSVPCMSGKPGVETYNLLRLTSGLSKRQLAPLIGMTDSSVSSALKPSNSRKFREKEIKMMEALLAFLKDHPKIDLTSDSVQHRITS